LKEKALKTEEKKEQQAESRKWKVES